MLGMLGGSTTIAMFRTSLHVDDNRAIPLHFGFQIEIEVIAAVGPA